MLERRHQKLASASVFLQRLFLFFAGAFLLILVSLFLGLAGYHWIAGLSWVDALLNASMILGGMGPVNTLNSNAAKIFASFYALFSGIVFIATMGIVLTPIVHRALHKFHMDEQALKK